MDDQLKVMIKTGDKSDLMKPLNIARSLNLNGIITQLGCDDFKREYLDETVGEQHQNFTRNPLAFTSHNYINEIIPMINITSILDNQNEEVRRNYEEKISTDLKNCFHIKPGGPIYVKASCNPETLGKFLHNSTSPYAHYEYSFVIEVDLVSKKYYQRMHMNQVSGDDEDDDDDDDTWSYWNKIHKAANYNPRFEVALVMSADMPFEDKNIVCRWLGEQVAMLVFPSSCFKSNSNNYPVLSSHHRAVAKLFMECSRCIVVIEPRELDSNIISHYRDYLDFTYRHIKQNIHSTEKDLARFPLQPLRDDLDFGTYETFELDKAKYSLYQKAIENALIEMVPEEEISTKVSIIVVVGAGRGALVRASLNARTLTKRKVKIIIVEKNRNAVNTLRGLVNELWFDEGIQIIANDMRNIELEEKADIIISELLGSFGDNELSPECLDGAQRLLKDTGISIPCNSINYLRPIMSKRINANISRYSGTKLMKITDESRFQSNWLVYMLNVFYIDKPKEVFKFVHPNKEVPIDNSRYSKLTFNADIDCILHGFAGYFTSNLYKDIEISIHPETHTRGMQSWYSIYFPIPEPIHLKKNDTIELAFWRKVDETKVWYEYQILSPMKSKVINEDGKYHPILL